MQSSRRWWFLLGILGLLAGSLATFADRPGQEGVAVPGTEPEGPGAGLRAEELRASKEDIPELAAPPAVEERGVERAAVTRGWDLEVEVRGVEVDSRGSQVIATVQLGALGNDGGFKLLEPLEFRADGRLPEVRAFSPFSAFVTADNNLARLTVPEAVDSVSVLVVALGYQDALLSADRGTGRLVVQLVRIPPVRILLPGLAPRASHYSIARHTPNARTSTDESGGARNAQPLDRFGTATLDLVPMTGSLAISLQWHDPYGVQAPMVVLSGAVDVTPERRAFSFPDVVSHAVQIVPPDIHEPYRLEFKLAHPAGIDLPRLGGWSGGYGLYGGLTFQSEPDGRLFVELLTGSATHVKLESQALGKISLEAFDVWQSGVAVLTRVD